MSRLLGNASSVGHRVTNVQQNSYVKMHKTIVMLCFGNRGNFNQFLFLYGVTCPLLQVAWHLELPK